MEQQGVANLFLKGKSSKQVGAKKKGKRKKKKVKEKNPLAQAE